jgi:hypothetical protein
VKTPSHPSVPSKPSLSEPVHPTVFRRIGTIFATYLCGITSTFPQSACIVIAVVTRPIYDLLSEYLKKLAEFVKIIVTQAKLNANYLETFLFLLLIYDFVFLFVQLKIPIDHGVFP